MATRPPYPIPFPLSSFPGQNSQESSGRLINCTAEPLGEGTGPAKQVWRRQPGLTQYAPTTQTGYRGGLVVVNLSYEAFKNEALTVDNSLVPVVNILGSFPGTKKVSIARNQAATPDVVGVDIDNGAYQLSTGGAPVAYNGGGNLPQPNSVCFQDGYFFFTISDGRCFASGINALTQNALTFITAQSKSDVVLLRGIAYSGLLFLFTTGGCEVWQDAAVAAPAFPYNRQVVLPFGLVQANAIAGWETGFDDLIWVGQDFGVWRLPFGSLSPQKVSPPDLDRFIEAQIVAGNTLEAGCYMFGGKKFWHLSSAGGSWEFNLGTGKWNERESFNLATGLQGRWRFTGGHPAFGKWLGGDTQSGSIFYPDDQNFTEHAAPQLFRIESGPVRDFPNQLRIARADFDFVVGEGQVTRALLMNVTGSSLGVGGVVRLAVNDTAGVSANDTLNVAGVGGTVEANGTWPARVIDSTHLELIGSVYANAYTSGGTVTDVTTPPNVVAPMAAVSCSKDGGNNWGNPLIRQLGQQGRTKGVRISVKSMGLSNIQGVRWRLDVTDGVYVGLLGGTQNSDPKEVGA
jgi:hypothetical protein